MAMVISSKVDQGTRLLREFISDIGGVVPASRVLGEDPQTISAWTTKGLPGDLWDEVRRLRFKHLATPEVGQDPGYCCNQAFPLVR